MRATVPPTGGSDATVGMQCVYHAPVNGPAHGPLQRSFERRECDSQRHTFAIAAPLRAPYPDCMRVSFSGELWFWRGPSPFHFVTVPEAESAMLASTSELVSYGWGMIPATVYVGATSWPTALWPKDGGYIVPVKAMVRKAEQLEVGDTLQLHLDIGV
jgi:hypothetical protein